MFSQQTVEAIHKIADSNQIERAALLAVAEVESGGVPFWKVGGEKKPAIRFEGHYFYRLLPKAKRDVAVRRGLANSKAGKVKNPRSFAARYELLEKCKEIDEEAAIASCSWGVGQVMGDHWRALGYASAKALMEACETVAGQVDLMVRFIKKNNLKRFIDAKNWKAFASRYNGPNYKKNKYAKKMAAAYKKYTKGFELAKILTIKQAQKQLKVLGFYSGVADGYPDKPTIKAIKDFQRSKGLAVDGVIGPITSEALSGAEAAKNAPIQVTAMAGTAATLIGAANAAQGDPADKAIADGIIYFMIIATIGLAVMIYLNREHLANMFIKAKPRDKEADL